MKKGLLISTTLAMLLGVGVAVGAHQAKEVQEVKAAGSTLYLDTNKLTWYGDQSRAYLYGSGGNNGWPGQELTHVSGSIYSLSIPDTSKYQSAIFLRSNGTDVWNRTSKDGGTAINLPSDWSKQNMWTFSDGWGGNEYDDGNYTGSWSLYTPPAAKYSVDVYVDGVKRGTEQIGEGLLPDEPAAVYGKSFSGWFDNEACSKGHEVTGITGSGSVYCKMNNVPTVTYTIDDSSVEYSALKLYAFEPTGKANADWPGVDVAKKSITVPNDATLIINDGTKQTVNVEQSKVANDTLKILAAVDGEGHNTYVWGSEMPAGGEGYYIKGSASEWAYVSANKMSTSEVREGYVAQFIGFTAKADDEIRVVSYYTDRTPFEQWSDLKDGKSDVGTLVGDNLKFTADGVYDVYAKYESEHFVFEVNEHVEPDIPAEEGYYIKGSAIGWKYDTALKMDAGTGGNVAQKMNITAAINDEIRVCSYYNDRDPKNAWAEVGNDFDPESEYYTDFGVKEGDNFKFTAAGNYDIYAKYESDVFKFYVAKHVDSYTIAMHGVKYAGKDKVGTTVDFDNQTAYATANFDPAIPEQDGYIARGVYYDEACTEAYTPKKFTEADDLYIKYTKLTSYLTGDDTFLGEGHGWNVDYSTEIGPEGANKYVGTVVVPAGVDADHPMNVKPLEYVVDADPETEGNQPGWGAIYFTPGYEEKDAPDFVSIDKDGNFSFTKEGTYVFYVNNEDKVWFNGGEYAFHAAFLTQVGGTCDADGKNTDLEALGVLWGQLEIAYGKLSPAEKEHVESFTINGGDEKSEDDCKRMIAMYSYIVHKYGTETFKDFIWGGSYAASANMIPFESNAESNTFIVVAVIASITTVSAAVLLVLKKKKRQ